MRSASLRRSRRAAGSGGLHALSGFFEDIGILARYALGLDYYGRGRTGASR